MVEDTQDCEATSHKKSRAETSEYEPSKSLRATVKSNVETWQKFYFYHEMEKRNSQKSVWFVVCAFGKPVYDKTFFCISGSTVFLQSLDWHAGILIHKPRQQNLCADTDGTGCETIGAGWETCGATDLFKNSCPIKTCSKNQYYNNDNKRSFHKKC